jgi:putative spermidine/putrescine transport system permease protein
MAYQKYISSDLMQRPYAMVIAVVLTVVCVGLIYFYKKSIDLMLRYN